MDLTQVHVAVLLVSNDHASSEEATLKTIVDRMTAAGHRIVELEILDDSAQLVRAKFLSWIADLNIDVVIAITGGATTAIKLALGPLITTTVDGFSELVRMISLAEVGSGATGLDLVAAQCNSTLVFVMPALSDTVRGALEKLIIPQLDHRTKPTNLVGKLPRLREALGGPAPLGQPAAPVVPAAGVPSDAITPAGGVPLQIRAEITSVGVPPPPRSAPRTRTIPPPPPPARKRPDPAKVAPATGRAEPWIVPTRVGRPTAAGSPPAPVHRPITSADRDAERAPPWISPKPANAAPGANGAAAPVVAEPSVAPVAEQPVARPARKFTRTEPPPPPKPRAKVGAVAAPRLVEDTQSIEDVTEHVVLNVTGPQPIVALTEPAEPAAAAAPDDAAPLARASKPVIVATKPPVAKPQPAVEARLPAKDTIQVRPMAPPVSVTASGARASGSHPRLESRMFDDRELERSRRRQRSKLPILLVGFAGTAIIVFAFLVIAGRRGTRTAARPPADAALALASLPADAPMPPPQLGAPPPVDATAAMIELEPDPPSPTPARPMPGPRPGQPATVAPRTPPRDAAVAPEPGEPDLTGLPSNPPTTADSCDEVSCILEKYARPCCEKFRPPDPGPTPAKVTELDKAMIRAGVDKMRPVIIRCGETSPAKGTVKVAVEVSPGGRVESANVSQTPDAELGACVARAIKRATFARTTNGGTFSYPFVF